ncbi:S-adenosyl-methyltransferase MraW [Ammonifex degensii KC4]|uniref:Ribosomal RNA small subunit methyltransferase H n=2 Tax=Ammonifex degensii TaxID=42838 RepID=C9R8N8_AMMDK|nr:S-adenosyl-methyltransferase MraW [Ammonifex degensii KC4]
MVKEVLAYLAVKPGGVYVDCTVGGGGHAAAILAFIGDEGRLIGLDRDPEALSFARKRLGNDPRVHLVHASFADLAEVLAGLGVRGVDGVLYDLGVSSYQLDRPERGFTYREDAPLDMRFDPSSPVTAADLVNRLEEKELACIIREFGEERWAKRIARFIVRARARRPILTTGQLVEIIKEAIPASARRRGPHPARRTFQALRIAVNRELEALKASLPQAADCLKPGGRLVVLSYHSLEDRLVKGFFRQYTCLRPLTKKPLTPSPEEVKQNPRASSCKLRAAEKILNPEGGE